MAYGRIIVSNSAQQVVAKNTSRIALLLFNYGNNDCFICNESDVTKDTGYPILAMSEKIFSREGDENAFPLSFRDVVYVAGDTTDLRYWEILPITEFD
uniref:Uncharacterized protein n=1 Tax=viral metagenome TaxID=1070528 RepID=A0A6M3KYC3_9ZZZZ